MKNWNILCKTVKYLVNKKAYDTCREMILDAMTQYPDAPQPHNLLGILLEKEGDHELAMKHFRAAAALDSTYLPAQENMEVFGTFASDGDYHYGIRGERLMKKISGNCLGRFFWRN